MGGQGHGGTTHAVIVGGEFAGIACARRLATAPRLRVTLLERTGYHQFQPLLYQVATAELTPADIRFDLARMFRHQPMVEVQAAEVVAVDPEAPSVTLADGRRVDGDVVVLAAGAQPNFFHTPGAAEHAYRPSGPATHPGTSLGELREIGGRPTLRSASARVSSRRLPRSR